MARRSAEAMAFRRGATVRQQQATCKPFHGDAPFSKQPAPVLFRRVARRKAQRRICDYSMHLTGSAGKLATLSVFCCGTEKSKPMQGICSRQSAIGKSRAAARAFAIFRYRLEARAALCDKARQHDFARQRIAATRCRDFVSPR